MPNFLLVVYMKDGIEIKEAQLDKAATWISSDTKWRIEMDIGMEIVIS